MKVQQGANKKRQKRRKGRERRETGGARQIGFAGRPRAYEQGVSQKKRNTHLP